MEQFTIVGRSLPQIEARDKATGAGKYAMDLEMPRMLWAKVKRSTRPHARIVRVDTNRAEALPGVRAVITDKDCPQTLFGFGCYDEPLLARGKVRYVGEPVAAVAADTEETAEEACDLIEVEYEDLPAIFDAWQSFAEKPPAIIHEGLPDYRRVPIGPPQYDPKHPNAFGYYRIRSGDVERGFKEAEVIVENTFTNAMIQHGMMEPHNSMTLWDAEGNVTTWSSTQSAHCLLNQISEALDVPHSRVRVVIPKFVGGSFGGKIEMKAEGLCAVLSKKTGHRPVKNRYTREEATCWAGVQHPFETRIKTGVKKDGTLVACEMFVLINGGAYAQHGFLVTRQASYGPIGSYRIPNFKLDNYIVYTNQPMGVAYRGFGNTQIHWAFDSQMDCVAHAIGMDPVAFRLKNALGEGEVNTVGEVQHCVGAKECIRRVAADVGWGTPLQREDGPWRRGRGIAVGNKFSIAPSSSCAFVKMHNDETLEIRGSWGNMGQGPPTAISQMVAEAFKVGIEKVRLHPVDTWYTPYDQLSASSRLTFAAGNAVLLACEDLKKQIFSLASKQLEVAPEELDIANMKVFVKTKPERSVRVKDLYKTLFFTGSFSPEGGELLGKATFNVPADKVDPETGCCPKGGIGKIFSFCSHTAQAVQVAVNIETGQVRIEKMAMANDVGRAINPMAVEGQMECAAGMGVGGALFEELVLEEGRVLNPNLFDFKIPTSMDVPTNDGISKHIIENIQPDGPYNAKGLGESVVTPTAPAIANAIYDAAGVRMYHMPMTPERVWAAIKAKVGQGGNLGAQVA
jgi:CO/xanthine dehydrogenase Mo-binding subunit